LLAGKVIDLTFDAGSGLTQHSMKRALILGAGYTGQRLKDVLQNRGYQVFSTRRTASPGNLQFALNAPETWKSLPEVDVSFVTFPCEPKVLVEGFLSNQSMRLGRVICIGTTSSYLVETENEVIREGSPLNLQDERVLGELAAIQQGATVVRSAGIYGPSRDPRRWVSAGRVGPSLKLVNFIHVTDLVEILIQAYERGRKGAVYLAADGQPQRWDQLIESWISEYGIQVPPGAAESRRSSKRIDPSQTLKELGVTLLFPDVQSGVRSLA